jgi:hypothetical protein
MKIGVKLVFRSSSACFRLVAWRFLARPLCSITEFRPGITQQKRRLQRL